MKKKRFYRSWIAFLNNDCPILYNLANAMILYRILNPLIIKTLQKPKFDVVNIQGGKILQPNAFAWNEKNLAKWTHDSPINSGNTLDWRFLSLSLSCPDILTARKNDTRPDLLLELSNLQDREGKGTSASGSISQILSLSVCEDIISTSFGTYRTSIEALIEFLQPTYVAQLRSQWIYRRNENTTKTLMNAFPGGTMVRNWREISELSVEIFDLDNGAKFQVLDFFDPKIIRTQLSDSVQWNISSDALDFTPE